MSINDNSIHRLACAQRINIVGVSGSGKSTLGRFLGRSLNLPYFELDDVFWQPSWTESSDAEFLPKVETIVDQPCWVLDGNYSRTQQMKWSRAQVVIWIDLSLPVTLWRVTKRTLKRSLTQETLWSGNKETLSKALFSRSSIILWVLTSYRRVKRSYTAALSADEYSDLCFIRLTSQAQINELQSALEEATQGAKHD